MRLAILGNSGSGKSTLARWAATEYDAALLDLDTVAWEPGQAGVPRPDEEAFRDVRRFCALHQNWVVEGCYGHLIGPILELRPKLVFLNPGEAACLANCRARPWEPHKYATAEEQDKNLAFLLSWVSEYYTRDGNLSLASHRECFDSYGGPKVELNRVPDLADPGSLGSIVR